MSTVEIASTLCTIVNGMIPQAFRAALCFAPRKTLKPIECGVHVVAGDGVTITSGYSDAGESGLSVGFRARLPSNENGARADIVIPRGAAETWGKNDVESIDVESCAAAARGIRSPVEDGEEFPHFHSIGAPSAVYSLPFPLFRTIAEHIGSATDTGSSRYALGGIFVESGAGCVRFVGTDGRRLHVARIEGSSDGAFSVVIPAAVFTMAAKAIDKTIGGRGAGRKRALEFLRVVVSFDDSNGRGAFSWNVGNCEFDVSWKKIDGRYPKYRDVFPEYLEAASSSVGWLNVDDVLEKAETCRKSICTPNSKGIDIIRDSGECQRMEARSADKGGYSQVFKGYLPVGFKTKLDPTFVVDAIRAAAAFDTPPDGVSVWCNPDTLGTVECAANAVFFGKAGSVFSANENGTPAVFAAVILPLAAD
jgi:hypothetical protein